MKNLLIPMALAATLAACGESLDSSTPPYEEAIIVAADSALSALAAEYPDAREAVRVAGAGLGDVSINRIAVGIGAITGQAPLDCGTDACLRELHSASVWIRLAELTVDEDSVVVMVESFVPRAQYSREEYFVLKPGPRWRVVEVRRGMET